MTQNEMKFIIAFFFAFAATVSAQASGSYRFFLQRYQLSKSHPPITQCGQGEVFDIKLPVLSAPLTPDVNDAIIFFTDAECTKGDFAPVVNNQTCINFEAPPNSAPLCVVAPRCIPRFIP